MITISGTMAMHMFVPALPVAARGLAASAGEMQMAISIYIIGLAVGQLFYGPLSDALGRRPLLIAGLALYAVGSVAAALAPGLRTLLAARLVQALGGCAGLALGRAIVRDTTQPESAVRQLALLNLMIMVGPGLAPMVGGALSSTLGWRAIFVLLAAAGALTLWFTWRLLPETSRPSGQVGVRPLLRDYRALVTSPRFAGLALGGGCATTSVYAFLAAAPFIFVNELHQPVHLVGVYTGMMVLGMAVGNALTGRLSRVLNADRLLRIGNTLSLASAIVLIGIVLAHRLSVPNAIGLVLLFTCGCGMASPAALAKAVGVEPRLVGSAAGLYGFSQMAIGAGCTALAALGSDPALSATAVMVGATAFSQLAFTVALRRERAAGAL
ncbi:MAG: multidrug effflux MFS transporter [Burkholderiales bacterium]|nr:multidrug effflux MFS transporter [Burkholderiales bacterium]